MAEEDLSWICDWYLSQCNSDWEYTYGVSIKNLDNPGWMVEIDLEGTEFEGKFFEKIEFGNATSDLEGWRDSGNWWVARVENNKFQAFCGPLDLPSILKIFRTWIESAR